MNTNLALILSALSAYQPRETFMLMATDIWFVASES
jgi:hypothetical protein